MIIGKILNENATTNNYKFIESQEFLPGFAFTCTFQIFDDQMGLRYIPPVTNVVTIILNKTDGTQLEIVGTHNVDDRSMVTFEVTALQASTIYSGNFTFELDLLGNGTSVKAGIVERGLRKITNLGEC